MIIAADNLDLLEFSIQHFGKLITLVILVMVGTGVVVYFVINRITKIHAESAAAIEAVAVKYEAKEVDTHIRHLAALEKISTEHTTTVAAITAEAKEQQARMLALMQENVSNVLNLIKQYVPPNRPVSSVDNQS